MDNDLLNAANTAIGALVRDPDRPTAMSKLKSYVDLARPFTLLPPALGVVSGAVTAWGAHGTRDAVTLATFLPVLWGALMAAVLELREQRDQPDLRPRHRPREQAEAAAALGGPHDARGVGLHPRELRARLAPRLARRASRPRGAPRVLLDRALHERPRVGLLGAALPHEGARASGRTSRSPIPRGVLLKVAGWSTRRRRSSASSRGSSGSIFGLFLLGASTTKDFADIEGDRGRRLPHAADPLRGAARRRG